MRLLVPHACITCLRHSVRVRKRSLHSYKTTRTEDETMGGEETKKKKQTQGEKKSDAQLEGLDAIFVRKLVPQAIRGDDH